MNSSRLQATVEATDYAILGLSGAVAAGCAIVMTPLAFWLPAWAVLAVAFGFARWRRDGRHGPSTLFGVLQALYIVALVVLLARGGLSLLVLSQLCFGLFFVHSILYLIAARPFLARRGYLKRGTEP